MTVVPGIDAADEGGIDLGHGVRIQFTNTDKHAPVGLIEWHIAPGIGAQCGGAVLFDLPGVAEKFPGRPLWQVQSYDPLTLTPSLLCTTCGHHGFITEGRWVPAN